MLPKKWCIKVTKENSEILHNWRKSVYATVPCHYNYMTEIGSGNTGIWGEEISFEKFKQYVLNISEEILIEKNEKLTNLLIKHGIK